MEWTDILGLLILLALVWFLNMPSYSEGIKHDLDDKDA